MLIRICTVASILTACLGSWLPRSADAEEPSSPLHRAEKLSGEASWFPLGGEVYHSEDRFEAEGTLLAFKPQPRWFIGLVRQRGPLEENAAKEQTGSGKPKEGVHPPTNHDNVTQGPPLSPPKRLDDLPVTDQGASLSFSVSSAGSPDRLRFSLTLKAAERTVWREVEHRWTNTLPLLFAFYADGKAVKHTLTEFLKWGGSKQSEKVVEKGREKTWSLLVDAKSLEAILENRHPSELEIVAVFSERQHQGYFERQHEGHDKRQYQQHHNGIIESQVPQTAIVVRSNVVRLKRSAGQWEIVPEPIASSVGARVAKDPVADLNGQIERFNSQRPGNKGINSIDERVVRIEYVREQEIVKCFDRQGTAFLTLKRQQDGHFMGTIEVRHETLPDSNGRHSWGRVLAEFSLAKEAFKQTTPSPKQAEPQSHKTSSEERTWVSITANDGCKPGGALALIEKAGKATGGKVYILDPNHPRDLSKGLGYDFSNMRHEGKTITGDVSVIDGSSKTGRQDIHLTITLKEAFDGDRVQAEVQEGDGEKRPVVFVRNKDR